MSERHHHLTKPTKDMAQVVVIGGLYSFKTQWPYYSPLLESHNPKLVAKDRFFPIPDQGLSPVDEMYGQLEEQIAETHEKLEDRLVVVSHSLGALLATKLGINHPDKITDVICLAGCQDGIKELTRNGRVIKKLLGNPPTTDDLFHDSDVMSQHRKDMANNWPSDVGLHIITPTYDDLIPAPQGLELKLPHRRQPERRIVVPIIPHLHFGIREKTSHIDNVKELRPILPAGHYDIAICPSVITYSRHIRKQAYQNAIENEHSALLSAHAAAAA